MAYKSNASLVYKGNAYLPKAGNKQSFTAFEEQEIAKCMVDPIYFAEQYFKVVHQDAEDGVIPLKLYGYQKDAIEKFVETNRLLMATARQVGKVEPMDNLIPLFSGGFTTMREIKVGDLVIGSNGKPTTVTYKTPVLSFDSYRVTFDDRTSIEVGSDHLWTVTNRINHRKVETKDTKTLAKDFRDEYSPGHYRYTVQNCDPVEYSASKIATDPYIVGQLSVNHIPDDYLFGSVEQRLSLLQGIMDTVGYVDVSGVCQIQFANESVGLISDTIQLLCSLGIKVFITDLHNDNFNQPVPETRLTFTPSHVMQIARMPYKVSQSDQNCRSITNIEAVGTNTGHCISVDAANHLYLTSNRYVPTHNTTVATVLILWVALFNKRKNIALLADKQDTATEVLDRIQIAYEYLPTFLKGGVKVWNKKSVEFENGSKIFASATGSNAVRGKSLFFLYIDEAAHVENWDEFAAAVLPTVSASKKSKIVLTSTPNGMNHFYNYYEAAKNKQSEYPLVEVPWWEVDGRDDSWKQKTLADMNFNEQKFAQEQCVEFLGSSGTLISGATLKILKSITPVHVDKGLSTYSMPYPEHMYVLIADVSRGKGLDYSAFHVIDITATPFQQVCTYRNNMISATDYAAIIDRVGRHYNDAQLLIELNDNGGSVIDLLQMIHGYENLLQTQTKGISGKQLSSGFGRGNKDQGIRTNKLVKATGCAMIKAIIEQKQLIINDFHTIEELKTFSAKSKLYATTATTYEAEAGKHDDMAIGLVLFGWLTNQSYFKSLTDTDILQQLRETESDDLEDYLIPFGIINDGIGGSPIDDFVDGFEQSMPSDQFEQWLNQ